MQAIVNDEVTNHIITWRDDGESFMVADRLRLETEVLGCYFESDKFEFFKRQLKVYGFSRLRNETKKLRVWAHPLFKKDEPELISMVLTEAIQS